MAQKKYASLQSLQTFLDNLKEIFSTTDHSHKVSDITDYVVDTELSSTSTNPVQNKIVNAEFDAIADAMGALESVIDGKPDSATISETYETKEDSQLKYDTITEAKADWNQNDTTAIDYIKNRTHWVEQGFEELLPEQDTIYFQETNFQMTDMDGIAWSGNDKVNTLIVTFDGVEYVCERFTSSLGSDCWGDSRLSGDDTHPMDVPFVIECGFGYAGGEMFGWEEIPVWFLYLNPDIADTSHTIKIGCSSGEVVHVLDEKFIPDTIARVNHVHNYEYDDLFDKPFARVNVDYLYNGQVGPVSNNLAGFVTINNSQIELGHYYTVVLLDVYGTLLEKYTAQGMLLGTDNTLFSPYEDSIGSYISRVTQNSNSSNGIVHFTDGSNGDEFIVKIYDAETYTVQQIDEEFIPESIARKSDLETAELITVEDIDAICGGAIQYAEDVMF